MSNNDPTSEPATTLVVTSLDTLRVISDGLRARILDLLRAEPLTAKTLAERLALAPKQLYYHLNLMERHGLLRVVATRVVSGITEKTYRATAYLFLFDKSVFASGAPDESSLPPGIGMLFGTTRNQLAQSYEAGLIGGEDGPPHQQLMMEWTVAHIPPERLVEFQARLREFVRAFQEAADKPAAADVPAYRLLFVLFPVQHTVATEPTTDGDG
jgi:DNA-binding transcriptional ArsR family regulator